MSTFFLLLLACGGGDVAIPPAEAPEDPAPAEVVPEEAANEAEGKAEGEAATEPEEAKPEPPRGPIVSVPQEPTDLPGIKRDIEYVDRQGGHDHDHDDHDHDHDH